MSQSGDPHLSSPKSLRFCDYRLPTSPARCGGVATVQPLHVSSLPSEIPTTTFDLCHPAIIAPGYQSPWFHSQVNQFRSWHCFASEQLVPVSRLSRSSSHMRKFSLPKRLPRKSRLLKLYNTRSTSEKLKTNKC